MRIKMDAKIFFFLRTEGDGKKTQIQNPSRASKNIINKIFVQGEYMYVHISIIILNENINENKIPFFSNTTKKKGSDKKMDQFVFQKRNHVEYITSTYKREKKYFSF